MATRDSGAAETDNLRPTRLIEADDPVARRLVQFEGVTKSFGDFVAVDQLTLDIYEGEFFALLGPSGCGKTTLLRMLAGFERPSAGRILLDGKNVARVPPHRRPVNMMFQNYALFPHLTVEGNIAFGLRQERLSKSEIEARVAEMLALVRLEGFGPRRPDQLSGGERQRVALARALAKRPRVFLLDEPLAALDRRLREDTRFELLDLQHRLGVTFIIVTHDQEEAMMLADRIGVMHEGRLIQVGSPSEVYEQPNSRWVAEFVGDVNLLEGHVASKTQAETLVHSLAGGRLRAIQATQAEQGATVWVAVRPEKVAITTKAPPSTEDNCFTGRVIEIAYRGDMLLYQAKLDNGLVIKSAVANSAAVPEPPVGRDHRVWVHWSRESCVVLTQ